MWCFVTDWLKDEKISVRYSMGNLNSFFCPTKIEIFTIMSFLQNREDPTRLRSTKNLNRILVLKNLKSRLTKRNCSIMAGCLSKSKELLRLIPDLQCHNCKSVPGPKENQKNRYLCLNENASHILCEEHKTKCPCGSKVGNRLATS